MTSVNCLDEEGPNRCRLHYPPPDLAFQETRTLTVVPPLGSVPSWGDL